ncbi:Holliday junction DNA helicase RuvB [Thermodesulfatator indicus DSM 15286]|uniref:Holliday junction branch migration complex subunit RuvB n=1 Tax=Thermodesulfatator indicus (strain DSM 15286 / JCM 11887 / CIR29812) TaxID=667014 RepID=F8AC67_THEID|nr:Holliday junction branch migration DNA helicase RuvB [Thermodesulfatator indicus]AEH44625.1 Holliday junction DNA helicase RuvB [Thermodesulfatator indicus DSM 15286]
MANVEIRPKNLADYIGQEDVKRELSVYLKAAKARGEALDHVLLTGFPGLGKTTLAHIIAHELGSKLHVTSGAALERPGDLAAILSSLSERDVLFVDEIHRLPSSVEEILYPAMEDFKLDIVVGKGPGARILRLSLPRFTLVGATTRSGLLSAPLRDRFGITFKLDFYNEEELLAIVLQTAKALDIEIDREGALEIAKRSRGTPRIANRLLKRVVDFACVEKVEIITRELARKALSLMDLDDIGLGPFDRKLLKVIMEKFDGGPVGLDTLATALCEDPRTLEDVYEPFLIRLGFIRRTKRGRVITNRTYEYFAKRGISHGKLF